MAAAAAPTTNTLTTTTYTPAEQAEITHWQSAAAALAAPSTSPAALAAHLQTLNAHLATRTTLLGTKPSPADVALYRALAPRVATWSPEQRTGERGLHHVVRHVAFVQGASGFFGVVEGESVEIDLDDVRVPIRPVDVRAEKERKRKEKEAAAAAGTGAGLADAAVVGEGGGAVVATGAVAAGVVAAGAAATAVAEPSSPEIALPIRQAKPSAETSSTTASTTPPTNTPKREKKPKPPKAPQPPPAAAALTPSLIDLRVGHILKAEQHPNADSLYVSTIAMGDPPGTANTSEYTPPGSTAPLVVRTVCSGLNGLVPLADMQGRLVVCVCNLKPVTMRGIKSAAMVLAASPRPSADAPADPHAGPVELVDVPPGSAAGDRVFFDGWAAGAPEPQLNPKKKVWESCQAGFATSAERRVVFDAAKGEGVFDEAGAKGECVLRTEKGVCEVKTLVGAVVR